MRVRFKMSWQVYKPGQEFDFTDGFANVLIRRGIVVEVKVTEEKTKRPKLKHA